jgi:hypothetical protein
VCTSKGCYADFYSSQAAVAADASGKLVFAYLKSTVDGGPKSLYVRTSSDGSTWSAAILVNARGDSNMPALAAGPTAGDFRLMWQDNRNGANAWNTWYARTTNGGATWSAPVRLSNLGSGAPYKTSAGTNFAIWGEGNGIYVGGGTGGSWWTRGG